MSPRTLAPPPTDRKLWRRLLAISHPDAAGGDHDLHIWCRSVFEYVCSDQVEEPPPRARRDPPRHPQPSGDRVPFEDAAPFADLTLRALRLAGQTLEHLLLMYRAEDDGRQLQRLTAEPPEENRGAPASVTNIDVASGVIGTPREAGPQRGEIEAILRLLQSYGEATEVGAVPDEDDDDTAAVLVEPGPGDDARNGAA